ncbi:ALMS1 protein, partial [Scytalopus superciliaris]|nr:ALMS1 protein [Scytalopus superciliaris]
ALSTKRRARMLNKGIQAGDLEIVSSATKRNTRDVGVTFPTPRSSQEPWHRAHGNFGGSDGPVTAEQAAGMWDKEKGHPGRQGCWAGACAALGEALAAGTSCFSHGEDLQSESRKENHSSAVAGPGPSWFEPWSSTKPWREPLREKNWEEQQHNVAPSAAP